MSREDITRVQETVASQAKAQIDNETNKLVAQAQIVIINQAINALPPPVNVGAKALSEGIYAAFKTPVSPVSNPQPDQDPVKLLALTIAFAILKALWCFIKSLLNPIPIVGSFFPLCWNDPQLAGTDQATTNARNKSNADIANGSLNDAGYTFNTATSADFAAATKNNIQTRDRRLGQPPPPPPPPPAEMSSGSEGITFAEFVARTVPASSVTSPNDQTLQNLVQNDSATSANIRTQPVVEPEWQPTEKDGITSYQAYRKLFGL